MKKTVIRIICLIVIFVSVIVIYIGKQYFENKDKEEENTTMLMGSATLPVVHTRVGGHLINQLNGYTMEMNKSYMREAMTLITSGRGLEIVIDKYDTSITGISYEISELEGEIVDSYRFDAWETEESKVVATVSCTDDIVQGEEYTLDICITTENDQKIHYYSVLKYDPETDYNTQLQFVKDFNEKSFDYKAAQDLIPYMEPSKDNANDNLGYVDLTSSFKQLTWAELKVKQIGDPVLTITDISAPAGSYKLTYQVEISKDDEVERYNVEEFYRLCIYDTRMFIVRFHRTMDQLYDEKYGNVSNRRMNLGIDSDLDVELATSPNNRFITFVKERQLWMMDTKNNEITLVFSFFDDIKNGVRECNENHDIKTIDIDESGNIWFLVYGYMNRGEHEGKSGVTLYKYNREDEIVEEIIYLPSNKPYGIIKEYIGELCYITGDTMYIYIDNVIYAVDLVLKEYVEIASGLNSDNYTTDDARYLLAWIDKSGENNTIRIKNLETGEDHVVKGGKGQILVPLSFMGEGFIYGVSKQNNVLKDSNGDKTILYSTIKIIDKEGNQIKSYKKKGKLITDVEVDETMLHFSLATKTGKTFEITGEDQIFNNTEAVIDSVAQDTIVTEEKQTEITINYASSVVSSEGTKLIVPKEVNTAKANALSIKQNNNKDNNYYVYGEGEILGIFQSERKAIQIAEEVKGFVTDATNGKTWKYVEKFK